MALLLKKSPDLGNSSPVPRALMYVASLQTSGDRHHHEDDRNRQMKTGTGGQRPKLGGCGQDWGNAATTGLLRWTLRIQTWFTDFYWALFEWFCVLFVFLLPAAPPTPIQLHTYLLQCCLCFLYILHRLSYEKGGHKASTYRQIEQYPDPTRRSHCSGRICPTAYSESFYKRINYQYDDRLLIWRSTIVTW
jgi:hypothetical protein